MFGRQLVLPESGSAVWRQLVLPERGSGCFGRQQIILETESIAQHVWKTAGKLIESNSGRFSEFLKEFPLLANNFS